MGYILASQLPRLKEYKYSGVDHSLVSRYVLKPFYTHVVIRCFPMWIAPNLITLIGFFFVVVNFLTMLWYCPGLDTDCPPWVYASWAVGLFLYQTFDAVDGAQARRTHQSGPLGELFDHGVDALNTTLEVLLFAAAMNLGQSWATVLTLFGCHLTFYVQTWEEYHTKTLYLGLVSGPVEGILTLCVVFAITAYNGGADFWKQSVFQVLGIGSDTLGFGSLPKWVVEMPVNRSFLVYGGIILGYNMLESCRNVARTRKANGQPVLPALLGLTPLFLTCALAPLYLFLQPEILTSHLLPFSFFLGLLNALSVGLIITAHLTKSPFPHIPNILVLLLVFGVLDSAGTWLKTASAGLVGWPSALGDGVYQVAYVFFSLGIAGGVYGSFVVDVVKSICDYLDIWCLVIKHPWVGHEESYPNGVLLPEEKKGK